MVILGGDNPQDRMSAMGQKQTSEQVRAMSALPPKADIDQHGRDVRFVPKADIMQCSNSRSIGTSTDEFLPAGNAGWQRARCSACGKKGATIQHPGWGGNHIGFLPFPT
jgi:hypothetical protein